MTEKSTAGTATLVLVLGLLGATMAALSVTGVEDRTSEVAKPVLDVAPTGSLTVGRPRQPPSG